MKLAKTICALVGAATLAGTVKGATSMAPESWTTLTPLAKVTADGALSLDGTQGPTYAFYNAESYGDVSLEARYSAAKTDGVMAVGFVIGSTDSENFIRVHYDRWSAILYRNTEGGAFQEIKRARKAQEPDTWYTAKLVRKGTTLEGARHARADRLLCEPDCRHGEGNPHWRHARPSREAVAE